MDRTGLGIKMNEGSSQIRVNVRVRSTKGFEMNNKKRNLCMGLCRRVPSVKPVRRQKIKSQSLIRK